jgi:hypothetical protein
MEETPLRTRQSQEEEADRELRNEYGRYVEKVADIKKLPVISPDQCRNKVGAYYERRSNSMGRKLRLNPSESTFRT